jgi:hypothetical protein
MDLSPKRLQRGYPRGMSFPGRRARTWGSLRLELWVVVAVSALSSAWFVDFGHAHRALGPADVRSVCEGPPTRSLRKVFDGHETGSFGAFMGCAPDPSPQAWPAASALLSVSGGFLDRFGVRGPFSALVLHILWGGLGVGGLALATARSAGWRSGLLAGLLFAFHPERAAWATSLYNVGVPLSLVLVAIALRRGRLAQTCLFVAGAVRPEMGVFSLVLGAWAWPGLVGTVVGVGLVPLDSLGFLAGGGGWRDLAYSWRVNLGLWEFVAPIPLWLGALFGVVRPNLWRVGVAVLVLHGLGALFPDYGARHSLFGGALLAYLTARAPAGLGWMVLPTMVFGLFALKAGEAAPAAGWPQVGRPDCVEVGDEPPIPGQSLPSWVHIPDLAQACLMWGEAPEHRAWSSRGLHDRALRMRHLGLRPMSLETGGPGPWRAWHRIEGH